MLTQTSPRMVPVQESARSGRQKEHQNKRQYKPAKSALEEQKKTVQMLDSHIAYDAEIKRHERNLAQKQ